jgi:hypothetical protein
VAALEEPTGQASEILMNRFSDKALGTSTKFFNKGVCYDNSKS